MSGVVVTLESARLSKIHDDGRIHGSDMTKDFDQCIEVGAGEGTNVVGIPRLGVRRHLAERRREARTNDGDRPLVRKVVGPANGVLPEASKGSRRRERSTPSLPDSWISCLVAVESCRRPPARPE